MRKYELFRIPHQQIKISDKRYLNAGELNRLFKGTVHLEEKLDGSQMGISFKGGKPYVQTRNSHLLENDKRVAFKGAWNWVWAHIDQIERLQGFTVFGEWLYIQHNLHYDQLPSFFIAFDVWDNKQGKYLDLSNKSKFIADLGFQKSPVLKSGHLNPDLVFKMLTGNHYHSNYSSIERIEGGVVKNYGRGVFGKMVLQEFLEDLDDESHWTGRTPRYNRLKDGLDWDA